MARDTGLYKRFYNSSTLCDVELLSFFGDRSFHAHKVVLAANSGYFGALFENTAAMSICTFKWIDPFNDPQASERLMRCMYGYRVDILGQAYGGSAMRARGERGPAEGWSDDWEVNLAWTGIRERSPISGVAGLHPRFRRAVSDTLTLYLLAKQYRVNDVCEDQLRQMGKVMGHLLIHCTMQDVDDESLDGQPFEAAEFASLFAPLYARATDPNDKMRDLVATWFEQWAVVVSSVHKLYEALPGLHLDVLHERQRRRRGQQTQSMTPGLPPPPEDVQGNRDLTQQHEAPRSSWWKRILPSRVAPTFDSLPWGSARPVVNNGHWSDDVVDTECELDSDSDEL